MFQAYAGELEHPYGDADKQEINAKLNQALGLSDEELIVEGRFNLSRGWGGPVLQVVKLFELGFAEVWPQISNIDV